MLGIMVIETLCNTFLKKSLSYSFKSSHVNCTTKYDISFPDPRVRHWNLISDESPVLLVITAYLVIVLLILPAYMKNRKPYDLTAVIKCYNIFQVLSNMLVLYEVSLILFISHVNT